MVIVTGFLFVSCSKENDNTEPENGNQPPTGNTLRCDVDGNDWVASLAVVASSNQGLVTITGSDSNSRQLMFSIHNVNGTGTYSLGGTLTNQNLGRWTQGLGQNDTFTTMLGQGSGTVHITELSATAFAGTFEFTAKNGVQNEIVISAGEFNAVFESK